jgi:hypothetical protein
MADRRLIAYGSAAAVFALDRTTKRLVETHISFEDSIRVIPGFFDIVHSQNRGVAFGIFNDSAFQWRTTLLVAASLVAVVVVSWILRRPGRLDRCTFWGLHRIRPGHRFSVVLSRRLPVAGVQRRRLGHRGGKPADPHRHGASEAAGVPCFLRSSTSGFCTFTPMECCWRWHS